MFTHKMPVGLVTRLGWALFGLLIAVGAEKVAAKGPALKVVDEQGVAVEESSKSSENVIIVQCYNLQGNFGRYNLTTYFSNHTTGYRKHEILGECKA